MTIAVLIEILIDLGIAILIDSMPRISRRRTRIDCCIVYHGSDSETGEQWTRETLPNRIGP